MSEFNLKQVPREWFYHCTIIKREGGGGGRGGREAKLKGEGKEGRSKNEIVRKSSSVAIPFTEKFRMDLRKVEK